MDDRATTIPDNNDMHPETAFCTIQCCHFCGKSGPVIMKFPHREYGGKYCAPVFASVS